MKAYRLYILCFAATLSGCSEPPPPKVFTPYEVEDLVVPGRLENARNSGFTDCKVDYYAYSCRRTDNKEVFGVQPTAISVSLDGLKTFKKTTQHCQPGMCEKFPLKNSATAKLISSFPPTLTMSRV